MTNEEKKRKLVSELAVSLEEKKEVMKVSELAPLLNKNNILTTNGTPYKCGKTNRGMWSVIRIVYNYYVRNQDQNTADAIVKAFVNSKGEHII